jgi:hypothetical protein
VLHPDDRDAILARLLDKLRTFATTASRLGVPATTPFCTSTTRSAVFGRFSSVVMVSPF